MEGDGQRRDELYLSFNRSLCSEVHTFPFLFLSHQRWGERESARAQRPDLCPQLIPAAPEFLSQCFCESLEIWATPFQLSKSHGLTLLFQVLVAKRKEQRLALEFNCKRKASLLAGCQILIPLTCRFFLLLGRMLKVIFLFLKHLLSHLFRFPWPCI